MKIAFDHQTFGQVYGGISRYYTQLALTLLGLNQDIGVFAPLFQNDYLKDLPDNTVHGKHLQQYPTKSDRLVFAYNQIVGRGQISRWRPDIVHETYYSRLRSAPSNCPTVITVYDMIDELFANNSFSSTYAIETKKIAVQRADHVICISNNTRNDLISYCDTPTSKVSVVYLGFNHTNNNIDSSDRSDKNILVKPYLLYVGGRGGYKNFLNFAKAVAASSRLMGDFDIVVFGGTALTRAENILIDSLGFSTNQVRHFSGNDSLLRECYRNARALVYPSLYEGFGLPLLEAMESNCPIICSNTSSMPEVAGDAAEYFDPRDLDDMRRAIEAVVYSETHIQSLRALGANRSTRFSWSKCAKETLEIYRRLAL